jgi:putative protein-(glutamine-N5) methyltransferase
MTQDQDVVARLRAAGCVFAEDEARLLAEAAHTPAELDAMTEQRAAGLPLEQVIGWAEFCGLRIGVDPGVFVPRRRSEFLVNTAVALAPGDPVVVDLCCGTGALGLATAAGLNGAELHAADIDPAAVRCARRNVEPAGGRVYEGDLFGPLPEGLRGRISILICNAPYVPSGEVAFLPAEARDHEPRTALDGGTDGLAVLRAVAAQAPRWLAPGGHLLVETSERQAPAMAAAMSAAGLAAQVRDCKESGATVVTASISLSRTSAAYSRSTMTPKVSVNQRRARLLARHRLSAPAATVTDATNAVVALHATDPATVYLSARARTEAGTTEAVDEALYETRGIVRTLGMRRTVFVVPAPLLPVVQRACTDDVARRLRRQLERDLANGGVGGADVAGWLRDTEAGALRALAARGHATGAQLSADEPRLRTQLVYAPDKSYGGIANITSRVLGLIAAEGHMIRGHRRGGWPSGQFEWFPANAWLANAADGAGDAGSRAGDAGSRAGDAGSRAGDAGSRAGDAGSRAGDAGSRAGDAGSGAGDAGSGAGDAGSGADAAARAELARRWLLAFGPAPAADLQWWAGWTGAQTKAALAALDVREVDLEGRPGVVLASDEAFDDDVASVASLLPALDPTPMGWQSRDWYLDPHGPALFDRTGNIGPSVWWQGRIVGGWAQRPSGEVVYRMLEDAGSDASAAVAAEAARLESWLGPARVTPRFRTPLERELCE